MEREDQDSPLKATLESKAREALGLPSEKEEKEREMREEKERELKERAHRGVGMRGGRQHHQSVIKEPKPGDGWSAKLDQGKCMVHVGMYAQFRMLCLCVLDVRFA